MIALPLGAARDLAAFAYADIRALVNGIASIRRQPGRALLWSAFVVTIVAFGVMKTNGPRAHAHATPPFWQVAIGDFWICGVTIVFGVILATGRSRWFGVFGSRAEALFVTRAHTSPAVAATYLQLREVVRAVGQGAIRFAYLIVVGIPGGSSLQALLAELFFFAACGGAIVSAGLPRALARGRIALAASLAGWSLIAVAAIPLLYDAARVLKLPLAAMLPALGAAAHPGIALSVLAAGDLRPVLVPLAVAALATAAFIAVARDAYPELYAISLAALEWRSRARARRTGASDAFADTPATADSSGSGKMRWRGALVLVWADALAFSRRVSRRTIGLSIAAALGAGAAVAVLLRAIDDAMLAGILLGTVPVFYITIASTTGVRLVPVLRLPLFWLGEVPLVSRLAAWSCGAMWRDLAVVALILTGYAAVTRTLLVPAIVLAGAVGLAALTRSVGLAVFALLPNAIDQRGPAMSLRMLAAFALVLPAALGGALAGFVARSAIAGTLAGTGLALAESGVLIGFAAWRLAGRVDLLSTA